LREFRDLSYADARMKNLLLTLVHLAVAVARLCGPGGIRAVIAENLLLKHQLIVLRRGRQRAPNLTQSDRLLCGFGSLFLDATRIRKVAIAFRLSTLLAFHQALVRRKYRLLFSARRRPKKPGPKGPDEALIRAIIELKSRNPRFGCPRIARIVAQTFGIDIDKNVVHRVLAKHYRPLPGGTGPSWLSFIGHATDSLWSVDLFRCESIVLRTYWVLVVMDQFTRRLVGFGVHCGTVMGTDVCRMFNSAIQGHGAPRRLSTDHDPLFEAHRWTANLRVLEIDEIKTVPHVPLSHPFVERLVGTMRREFLDHVLFWNACDLEQKLAEFQTYYNAGTLPRVIGRSGATDLGRWTDGGACRSEPSALGLPLPRPRAAPNSGLTAIPRRTGGVPSLGYRRTRPRPSLLAGLLAPSGVAVGTAPYARRAGLRTVMRGL
jgi:putative transposase